MENCDGVKADSTVIINNVPKYAKEKGNYIVARYVDGEWWFYGAYDKGTAGKVATDVGGEVFRLL